MPDFGILVPARGFDFSCSCLCRKRVFLHLLFTMYLLILINYGSQDKTWNPRKPQYNSPSAGQKPY